MIKRLEAFAKTTLALFAALLLYRPGRRRRARERLPSAKKVLLVRIDNRVGEALLTTPLLDALFEAKRFEVHLLVHQKAARVLEGHPHVQRLIPFDRRRLFLGALAPGIAALRRERYDAVIDCSNWTAPSVTAALVARLAGPGAGVIGPGAFPVSALPDLPVPARTDTRSEVEQRLHLLSPLLGAQGHRPLSFRAVQPSAALAKFVAEVGTPYAVVNPGGRLGIRRVPALAFSAAANALSAAGITPVITWGPGEESLAKEVLEGAPSARLAPPTSLDELAALMSGARLTVCNNTGPMHLSVSVGTPTLAFFLRMELARWGHSYGPHRMVDLTPVVESGGDLQAAAAAAVNAALQ